MCDEVAVYEVPGFAAKLCLLGIVTKTVTYDPIETDAILDFRFKVKGPPGTKAVHVTLSGVDLGFKGAAPAEKPFGRILFQVQKDPQVADHWIVSCFLQSDAGPSMLGGAMVVDILCFG
jgi:hypothetical protein